MMAQIIDRKRVKEEVRELLKNAQVPARAMTALYLGLVLVLNIVDLFSGGFSRGVLTTFVSVLISLLGMVLSAGFVLYCMAIRRGERSEYLTLFDGFSFLGKILALEIVKYFFIALWSMLFVVPGIIAAYRYRFSLLNLCERPGIGVMEALELSKRQTMGYKGQLFSLDLSYLGWVILASLPLAFESAYLSYHMSLSYMTDSYGVWMQTITLPFLPAWAWSLLGGLWALVVELFYLPNYQCAELAYFEIAKQTSTVEIPPNY